MIRAGFTFEHPTTRTRTVVLESDAETNDMDWLLEIIRYKGFAKLLFQSATIRTAIKHGNYVASPSMAMQKVMGATLGVPGDLLGYKAVNPKYVEE